MLNNTIKDANSQQKASRAFVQKLGEAGFKFELQGNLLFNYLLDVRSRKSVLDWITKWNSTIDLHCGLRSKDPAQTVPRQLLLEAVAKFWGYSNWDTLCGCVPKEDPPLDPYWHILLRGENKVYTVPVKSVEDEDEEDEARWTVCTSIENTWLDQGWVIVDVVASPYPWNGPDGILGFDAEVVERSYPKDKEQTIQFKATSTYSVQAPSADAAKEIFNRRFYPNNDVQDQTMRF